MPCSQGRLDVDMERGGGIRLPDTERKQRAYSQEARDQNWREEKG